jgi:hypothetical protein
MPSRWRNGYLLDEDASVRTAPLEKGKRGKGEKGNGNGGGGKTKRKE